MTQADLAQKMEVDVSTIKRWESGRLSPSLTHGLRLREALARFDGLQHPIATWFLNRDAPTALLDRRSVYRDANQSYLQIHGKSRDDLLLKPAVQVDPFWAATLPSQVGVPPDELAMSNLEIIDLHCCEGQGRKLKSVEHSITIVRMMNFSSMLIHTIRSTPCSVWHEESVHLRFRVT